MKKFLLLVLLLAAIGGGIAWCLAGVKSPAGSGAFKVYGNVDIREVNLGFRVPGRIQEVVHEEGDEVKAGELLARLDPEPYQREAAQARDKVASLQARLNLLEAGNRPQEIAAAQAVVSEREVTLTNAERLFKRAQELFANKTIAAQERDDAEAACHEAEARLKSAREQLALLEAGFRPEEIDQARSDLAAAQAALSIAELHLQDTELKAPSPGTVLTRAQEPGAVVQAGTTILTLSLVNPVWVRAYVDEPKLGRIHPGMEALVFTDSRSGTPYHGQIGYISPRAEFTPKSVETPELRPSLVYRFRVVVSDPDQGLRQGMPVTVELGAR